MAKYNTYIELSPNYESVVDLESEQRNPNLWQEYIIHEDMKCAVEKICESLRNETMDSRRSFWIHGAYGTGKSYAAIVLKHLFEDTIPNIQTFMSKPLLLPYRNKFVAIREKGDFLVVWKSGCTGIHTGIELMMEMEMSIRQELEEKFNDKAYYGRKSLIAAVQERLNDPAINWQTIFTDPVYGLFQDYVSFDEFFSEVMSHKLEACNTAAEICRDKGWALFGTVDMFENWVKDVIEGNGLGETGIIFIWDEFTTFVRECGDDNVLQRLAEYCKQQPFYMFLIVHIESSWVAALGEETYKRILHRYHELEFHISESAAYELIGDSILTRPNMNEQWEEIKDQLMKSIDKNMADFDVLDLGNQRDRLRHLCPLHPMTLSLLATVAQNFGASQRTLFRFMKDRIEAAQQVGFIHYIETHGPDDWRWLTSDFLWDYFFTRESDIKGEFSPEARRCYQHYEIKKDIAAADETAVHVFKAIMLLIAVMSTEKISQLRSQATSRKMAATKRTLYKCFAGQLLESDIDKYLESFEANGMILLDRQPNGDARLELPYKGNMDVFDVRLKQTKNKYTRYELFKKNCMFSNSIEDKMWDQNKATKNRLLVVACSSEQISLNIRFKELCDELVKNTYKIGILVVTIAEPSQYASMQAKLKEMAEGDTSGRLIICITKEPLLDERLDRWHRAITHKELAGEEGKKGSADQYEIEAATILEEWAQSAVEGQLAAFYCDTQYAALYGRDDLIRRVEKDVIFKVFSAAPELLVTQSTAFKRAQESAALSAITLVSVNTQMNNIAAGIKAAHAWDVKSLTELEQCSDTVGAYAIASLARYICEQLAVGAKVKVDSLWMELQKPPFGYYDSIACAYLLGFVLRFYKDGDFHWVDNGNNPFPLSEKNLATLIYKMCRSEVVNNTLSSGSEIWQQFRPYAQKIFKLLAEESTSEEQSRKYMRERIISSGTPFWVIRFIPGDQFGGDEAKNIVCRVTDALSTFIAGDGDQEDIMSNVITLFKGRGPIRQAMTDAVNNNSLRYAAFRTFIIEKQPQLRDLIDAIGINANELFDAIKILMQEAIYTWTEAQVTEKLAELTLEYQLINILNNALGIKRKTTKQLKQDLLNCFDNMKVPGSVIETLEKEWIPALKILRIISTDGWGSMTIDQKQNKIEILQGNAKSAWDHVGASKFLLDDYLKQQKLVCSEMEINNIFAGLKPLPYNTPEVSFAANLRVFIENISYERSKKKLLSQWKTQSCENSVVDWCNHHVTPIQWVLDGASLQHILLIKYINEGIRVDEKQLRKAVEFFEQSDLSVLCDAEVIQGKFITQIGVTNKAAYLRYREEILARIRIKFGADVFTWGHRAGEVRNIIEEIIREKDALEYKEKAKTSITKMPESDLRKRVIAFLEKHPEYCNLFLDSER
jgi:hypothetical protein